MVRYQQRVMKPAPECEHRGEHEYMRIETGGRMSHYRGCPKCGKKFEDLKYNGMDAAQLTLARAISKRDRLAKDAKRGNPSGQNFVTGRVK